MSLRFDLAVSRSLTIHAEAQSTLELFESLAAVQECFAVGSCGACLSERIEFRVRQAKKDNRAFTVREIVCLNCGAVLDFGTTKDGKIFPHRRDKDGRDLPGRGWIVRPGSHRRVRSPAKPPAVETRPKDHV
jgi:hypothetical protein